MPPQSNIFRIMTTNIVEIHKNGINAHHPVASYYGVDYASKNIVFTNAPTPEKAWQSALAAGYAKHEIQWHCNPF